MSIQQFVVEQEIVEELARPQSEQIQPPEEQLPKRRSLSTNAIVRQACLDVLADKRSHPRDKIKAAAILERMQRVKNSARARKPKYHAKLLQKLVQNEPHTRLSDLTSTPQA